MPTLLQINQICKSYGAATILDDATCAFGSDQKIGVIGRNGAGKSTLCRIITQHEKADSGAIIRNSALRLSYLEQHDVFEEGETVIDFLIRMTGKERWECGSKAARFQITHDMLDDPIQNFAGGYRTRVKLTAMLLGDPNFLILDEPSNYLDLSTLILLENFLRNFKGGYLVVSHDREFLKRTCDHTLEVEAGKLTLYPGDIEEYFEFKELERAQKQAYNQGVQKKRDQLQAFIERFRAKASTASRAQSKMKQLEKLNTIEIAHSMGSVRIHIPQVEAKAGVALSCDDLVIGYPEKEVARGIQFDVERGKRIAVLGNNGEGKTTFLRTIAGDLPEKAGTFRWGTGLKIAYYAQHVFSRFDPEDDIYAYLMRESVGLVTREEVLRMAGCFLFKGDDVKKKVKVLSGGERARLLLAGLLISKSHVLLLDEPTNHLDFETVEALGHALRKFSGTVFFISHDRTFVNLAATTILEVKQGRVLRYPGTYEDYVYHLEMAAQDEEVQASREDNREFKKTHKETLKPSSGNTHPKKDGKKESPVALKNVKERLAKAEQRFNYFTEEREKLHEEIRKNPFHFSKERNKRLKELELSLKEAEGEWYAVQGELDRLKGV